LDAGRQERGWRGFLRRHGDYNGLLAWRRKPIGHGIEPTEDLSATVDMLDLDRHSWQQGSAKARNLSSQTGST
jgi:hypothetical protein